MSGCMTSDATRWRRVIRSARFKTSFFFPSRRRNTRCSRDWSSDVCSSDLLAAASVVGVMVVQFASFVEPLVVLLAAPLSFVGAMALLLVTRTALNVSSFMGLILLVGLIVKNGIILLDFTRLRMQTEHVTLEVAIREAARVRLRPILMTTLCTLFGLLPLALGIGAGSELQRPLALAVIGGLALSTPITLFAVPT